MLPHTVPPFTVTLEALVHAVPVQYCIVVPEVAEESLMQTLAVPLVIPLTTTS